MAYDDSMTVCNLLPQTLPLQIKYENTHRHIHEKNEHNSNEIIYRMQRANFAPTQYNLHIL